MSRRPGLRLDLSGLERAAPRWVRDVAREAGREDILLFAAGLAFYALVSVAPLTILVLWITSLVIGDSKVQVLAEELRRIAPTNLGADKALQRIAALGTQVGVPAIVAGLWPATSYGAGLKRAFERLSSRKGRQAKGLRGRGLALLVLLPLWVVGGLVSSYLGTTLLGEDLGARIVGVIVAVVTGFFGAAFGIALIYRIFPPDPLSWRAIAKGTAVTAAGVSVLSAAFSLYLGVAANFEQHYASTGLAGFVLLAVWLFLSNTLLLVGFKAAAKVR